VSWNERRAFFGGSIDIDGNPLTVPMQLFRCIRIVVNIDRCRLPFFKTKQRSRKLPILCNRGNDSLGRDFDRGGLDILIRNSSKPQRDVWFALEWIENDLKRDEILIESRKARASQTTASEV